jgi:tetratricopeptide (TPR) repeat protein
VDAEADPPPGSAPPAAPSAGTTAGAAGAASAWSRAESLLEQARQEVNEQRPERAAALLAECETLLERAREGTDESALLRLRARMDLTRTWVIFEDAGPAAAVEAIGRCRDFAVRHGFADLVGACDLQLGSVRGRSGDLEGALRALSRAEDSREAMSTVDQARLFLNRGSLLSHLHQPSRAVADLAEASRMALVAERPTLAFMATHNEGYAHFLLGDVARALSLMEAADAMDVEVERSIARLDRARVMMEAGLVDEAYELLESAAQDVENGGSPHDLGEIELDLARCEVVRGRRSEAIRRARLARQRFHRRGETGWRHIAAAVELEAMPAEAQTARARERLGAALRRSAERHGDTLVRRRAALVVAEALIDQGRAAQADHAMAEAAALSRSPQLATRMHARQVSARLHELSGRPSAAVRTLRRAADDLGSSARQVSGLDLRTALAVHSGPLVDLDMSLATRGGSAARVLARTEVWRDVVRAVPPLRTSTDPRRAEAITQLRQARESHRQCPPGEPRRRAEQAVVTAERAVRELDWVSTGAPRRQATHGPMSASQIRAAVREQGVCLMSTMANQSEMFAVLVRPDGRASLHRLGGLAAIADALRATQADLAADARLPVGSALGPMVRGSLEHHLDALDEVLLAPVHEAGLDTSSLVVVPTPALMPLPWGMLPSRLARATTVARSATLWARRHAHLPGRPEVYAVAGPDVPLADEEVGSVVRAWGRGSAVEARASTAAGVIDALRTHDLVHVAAHGEHHSQNPLFSSLRVGDGPVFAHEAEGHELRASQVVLSACDAGRISVRRGEEPLGMTASLLALGVPTVVAAGSPVPDAVAHPVMSDYHARLAGGVDAATALAQASAQGDLLARAFTCYGSSWSITGPSRP